MRALFEQVDRVLRQALSSVTQQLGAVVGTIQGGCSLSMAQLIYGNGLGLSLVNDETRQFYPRFTGVINGNELVVTGKAEGRETELFRSAIVGPHPWEHLLEAATRYFTNGIAAKCEDL
jgi:hypothetical protein